MMERIHASYRDPANARRYSLAALLIATTAFLFIGIANALDAPEPGSVYQKEDALGILLVIGQSLPLVFALRYPMATLIAITGSFIGHAALDYDAIWVVHFSASFSFFIAVSRGSGRQSYLALMMVYISVVVSFGFLLDNGTAGDITVHILLFGGIWVVANLFRTRRIQLESTEQVVLDLEAEQDRLAREAVQDERARIARDLHDVLGHTLNLVVIQAGAAQRVFESDPEKALETVKSIESTSRQALSDVDRMLGILRDPDNASEAAPSLEARPSMARLESLIKEIRATGQPVELTIKGSVNATLAPSVDLSAFRVVQEALTNVMTHASGSNARVEIEYFDNLLGVTITNDGSGTDTLVDRKSGGRGVVGMRERAALFGGDFEADKTDDGGWRVHATFSTGGLK